MSTSVLVCDKSVPFASELAGILRGHNLSVALLGGIPEGKAHPKGQPSEPSALREIPWNRSSLLSARTVLLETKNSFGPLDQAVLVFDSPAILESVPAPDASDPAFIVDQYVRSYLFLAAETAGLFLRQKRGRLVFAVRSFDSVAAPSAGQLPSPRNIPLAAAEAAFVRLAEETAASFAVPGNGAVQGVLVKLDQTPDAEAAAWLAGLLLQPNAPRNKGRWIKAGAKGLLGLL